MRIEDLSALQLDALQELGNIGAGHAATALSQLVDRPIEISVPTIELVPVTDAPMIMGGPEALVAATYSRLAGDIGGCVLFVTPEESARALVDHLHNRPSGATLSFGHTEEQMYVHAAHLLASSYLAAVARMADLDVLPTEPQFALDMAGAVLETAVVRVGLRAESALVLRTVFRGEETVLEGVLLFLPDPESLEVILGRIGLA